jgi:hypothetical protein
MVQGVTPAHKGLAPSRLIIYLSINKRCPCWAHTAAIANAGESADMKAITLNKLTAKLKVKCLEIPHLP